MNDQLIRAASAVSVTEARLFDLRVQIAGDPAVQENLRVLAWNAVAPDRCVALGATVEVPEGWPAGVDGDALIEAHVEAMLGAPNTPGRRFRHSDFVRDFIGGSDDDAA